MTSAIEQLKERHAKELREAQLDESIAALLPADLTTAPIISNAKENPKPLTPKAWLSFRSPSYDPENTWRPIEVIEALERAGWTQESASLCKWDNYRRTPEAGLCESIPDTKPGCFGGTDKLNEVSAIAPIWLEPNQYGKPEAELYMRAGGHLFKISIDIQVPVYLTAERHEYRGGWNYKSGSSRLQFPKEWHGLEHCTISEHTRAYRDTEQGLSGRIYFMPHGEQASWPLSASAFLRLLTAKE